MTGGGEMGPATEIDKLALAIRRDRLMLRESLDQFDLIGFAAGLEKLNGFLFRQFFPCDRQVPFDDLADARFDFLEIFRRERPLEGEVVKETIFKRRTDSDLCGWKYFFYRLRHDVGAAMAVHLSPFCRIEPDWFYDSVFSQRP